MSDTTHEAPERIWITGDASKGSWNILKANFEGPTEIEYVRADRIEELEAKLAKAENALFTLSRIHDGNPSDARADILPLDYARHMLWEARSIASATLAELKGEIDE